MRFVSHLNWGIIYIQKFKCTVLRVLTNIQSYEHHCNHNKHFHHSRKFHQAIYNQSPSPPPHLKPQVITNMLSVAILLPFLEFYINKFIQHIILRVWLLSLSNNTLKFPPLCYMYQLFILFFLLIKDILLLLNSIFKLYLSMYGCMYSFIKKC